MRLIGLMQILLAPFISICQTEQASNKLSLLTPSRQEMIQPLFPHFTPYSDMMDLVLRASEFGIPSFLRRSNVLPDSLVFNIPEEYFIGPKLKIELHIPTYIRNVIRLAKHKSGRHFDRELFGQNLLDIFSYSIKPRGFERLIKPVGARYLMYHETILMSESSHLRQTVTKADMINSYTYDGDSENSQNIPLALLAMLGWKGIFWLVVSEMPNFYSGLRGVTGPEHKTLMTAPGRLDELSLTYIFHLCAALRKDAGTLPTDIPEGFCPNPCATSPCQTLPNTAGQQCHLIGAGLFMNEFR